jgi:hypothetical protein
MAAVADRAFGHAKLSGGGDSDGVKAALYPGPARWDMTTVMPAGAHCDRELERYVQYNRVP